MYSSANKQKIVLFIYHNVLYTIQTLSEEIYTIYYF